MLRRRLGRPRRGDQHPRRGQPGPELSWYADHVFARILELGLGARGVYALRREVLAPARGRVLEIGPGTGQNLGAYPDGVDAITAVAPEATLHERATRRGAAAGVDIDYIRGDVRRLPLETGSVDTAVLTFTLCSVADVNEAIDELARVLAPDGLLLFCEHIVARPGPRRWLQRLAEPALTRINLGCTLLGDPLPAIGRRFGFESLVEDHVRAMPPLYRRLIWGRARPSRRGNPAG